MSFEDVSFFAFHSTRQSFTIGKVSSDRVERLRAIVLIMLTDRSARFATQAEATIRTGRQTHSSVPGCITRSNRTTGRHGSVLETVAILRHSLSHSVLSWRWWPTGTALVWPSTAITRLSSGISRIRIRWSWRKRRAFGLKKQFKV